MNPFTYIMLAISFLDSIATATVAFTTPYAKGAWIWISLNYKGLGLAALLISSLIAIKSEELQEYLPEVPEITFPETNIWDNVGDLGQYLQRFIPKFPSSPQRFRLEDLMDMDGDDRNRIDYIIKAIEEEINQAGTAIKSHDLALEQLEQVLPTVVHMKLKDGKPVITDNFWHALRDLIKKDEDILTFDQEHSQYGISSQKQWNTIVARLTKDTILNDKIKHDLEEMEHHIKKDVAESWETWVRNNNKIIQEQLGLKQGQIADTSSIKALIKDQLKDNEANGRIITRDEFLRHIRNEFTTHRSEISAQFKEFSPQLTKLAQDSVKLALQDLPRGMNRNEIEALVANLVRKGIADLNLKSIANGQNQSPLGRRLETQDQLFWHGSRRRDQSKVHFSQL